MAIRFQDRPGRHERHLMRRHHNPLFALPPLEVGPDALTEARRRDQDESIAFQQRFRSLVRRAAELRPNEPSEVVLKLKAELEQAYEETAGLGAGPNQARTALRTLIEAIMRSLWRGAGDDPVAHQELEQEESARSLHFALLEEPLVADLLHPDSPISPDELAPSLLSASAESLAAALQLFISAEITALATDARSLLLRLRQEGYDLPQAWERLAQIEAAEGQPGSWDGKKGLGRPLLPQSSH